MALNPDYLDVVGEVGSVEDFVFIGEIYALVIVRYRSTNVVGRPDQGLIP